MKSRPYTARINNKDKFKKFLKRLLFKSIVVLAIILLLVFMKKFNFVSTNNFLKGLKNTIEYEFHVVKDGKKIYNKAKEVIGSSIETIGTLSAFTEKYDPPVVGSVYRSYDDILTVDDEKIKNGGVDIKAGNDKEPKAIFDGRVSKVYTNDNKGYYVTVQTDGIELTYGYLAASYVSEGEVIKNGEAIGRLGTSKDGNKYLRIELIVNGKKVDPKEYINFPENI